MTDIDKQTTRSFLKVDKRELMVLISGFQLVISKLSENLDIDIEELLNAQESIARAGVADLSDDKVDSFIADICDTANYREMSKGNY